MLAEASTSMRCCHSGMLGHINCGCNHIVDAFCLTNASQSARVIIGEDRLGHGLSNGETKRDMRRGVYMHIVRFEPAVPGSTRVPHDPLSHPTCARQKQITMCFPSHPCKTLPPTYTRQPNPPVDGDRSKQSDFCAGVLGRGMTPMHGESRVARAAGMGVERSFFTPISLWRVLCECTAVVTAPLLLPSMYT